MSRANNAGDGSRLGGFLLDLGDWDAFRLRTLGLPQARLRRLETKVDLLLEHAGLANKYKVGVQQEVLEALRRGDKIDAIKCYREATGAGPAEAKEKVEAIQASENL
jgi:pantothenate kinase-related protein Tda10